VTEQEAHKASPEQEEPEASNEPKKRYTVFDTKDKTPEEVVEAIMGWIKSGQKKDDGERREE
jgi:broad-specificity NMP kinase